MSNIPLFKVFMDEKIQDTLVPVLKSGYISEGKQVEKYENALKKHFGYPYVLSLNSATSGLTLGLRLLDLKIGDEVLSTPLTCTATNWAILANNLNIRWVDVCPQTCNVDLNDLEKKISGRTKAIMVVHWGGNPVDMTRLNQIRDKYNIPVIEDCSHAFGARHDSVRIGTMGNIAIFSTQAIKHLTTGDGGIICLPDKQYYSRAKLLRWYGISRDDRSGSDFRIEPDIAEFGFKYHMNDINATIGLANLPHVDANASLIQHNVRLLDACIDDLTHIRRIKPAQNVECAYWIYTIRVLHKDEFILFMKQQDITVSQVHHRNDSHSCVKQFKTHLPQLDELESDMVCIPCGWWLNESSLQRIIHALREWDSRFMLEFQVERFEERDKEEYLELLRQEWNYPDYYQGPYAHPHNEVYIVRSQDQMVGAGTLLIEDRFHVGHIENVIVHKDIRGFGVGKLVVKSLSQIAREAGCYKVVLGCSDNHEPFYAKCGFERSGLQMTQRFLEEPE